ncbi:MAG TPA: tRNA (adenosine(37)-N6)-threonylcarbamoyltransferase complex ATPase subunit type 1 TsaE [Azospirillaceae bacterium]|nr:tRNA (adenosine(37)-N6)-threonylcarbamoyltransferase complex ATPase subunit type 1 TsaE [Azospirillaceae bacterium]
MPDTTVTRTFELRDEAATERLAHRLGRVLAPGDVIALRGDLGAGKTAFARALIRSLTHADEDVPSPTFTLVQTYDTDRGAVWHFDLYRLSSPDEAIELGWDEVPVGIALVEWPDRLGRLLPAGRLDLTLSFGPAPTFRVATFTGAGSWASRLEPLEAS